MNTFCCACILLNLIFISKSTLRDTVKKPLADPLYYKFIYVLFVDRVERMRQFFIMRQALHYIYLSQEKHRFKKQMYNVQYTRQNLKTITFYKNLFLISVQVTSYHQT